MKTALHLALVLFAALLIGCAPKIGDKCKTSGDCSLDGTRICDTAQPGGYCTIQGCDPDSCPGGSVCVEWRFAPPRTAETYCMRSCRSNSACRDGYECVSATSAVLSSLIDCACIARVIDLDVDRDTVRFCAATGLENLGDGGTPLCAFPPDGGTRTNDAGVPICIPPDELVSVPPADAGTPTPPMDAGTDAGVDAG